jgi:hypothetical protein
MYKNVYLSTFLANSPVTANREVHANVLQSIIQAANRKKRRDKGGRSAIGQQSDADINASSKSKLFGGLPKSKGKDVPLNKSEENLVGLSESSMSVDETVSDSSTVADENEISLEIIRYPAYHFKDAGAYIVENSKPRSIRRAKSNDSLLTPKLRVANVNRTYGNVVTTGNPQVATTLPHGQEDLSEETSVTLPYGSASASCQYADTSASSAWVSSSAANNCSPRSHSGSVCFFEGEC